jgi:hypothetical protein
MTDTFCIPGFGILNTDMLIELNVRNSLLEAGRMAGTISADITEAAQFYPPHARHGSSTLLLSDPRLKPWVFASYFR